MLWHAFLLSSFFSLLLNELNAVISAHRLRLTGTFQSFDKPCLSIFFKQKTAYEIGVRLVGSEMCIRDSFSLLLNELNAVISAHRLRLTGTFQ